MAWRIQDSVIRGEIDNRMKGRVRGRVWLDGVPEPVRLDLEGNACPDLAGCLLKFKNPLKTVPMRRDVTMNPLQRGAIGDLTASRKVRVFDVPLAEAMEMIHRHDKPPEHMANCLYLEWFSEADGRVVIESADYELEISSPEWRMSPKEDEDRGTQASAGFGEFMQKLSSGPEKHRRGQKDPEAEWNEHDYERLMRESDARNEKYRELIEKYGDSEEAEAKIAEEMGWAEELTEEETEQERRRIEEINAACQAALDEPEPEPDPATEGKDWIRTEDGDLVHPLQHRCFEAAMKFWHACDALGLKEDRDDDLNQFLFEFQTTGAKLAGALNNIARDRGVRDGAFTVAYLKRALGHLHQSQAGLETVAPRKVLPEPLLTQARQELFAIREGILRLMDEYRGR